MMDTIRTAIRGLLGPRSWPYVLASDGLALYYALRRERVEGLRLLTMKRRRGHGVWMKFRSLTFPIFVRPGTEDVISIINNVFREEYGRLPEGFSPRTVIDAGAYVGDTSAYFLSRFKEAVVVALEPSTENFALAKQNLSEYGSRVSLLPRALWDSSGTVRIAGDQTGVSVSDQGAEVQTVTVAALLADLGLDRVDLLKMDIEGAEVAVLKSGVGGWLQCVDVLLLETHGKHIEDIVIPLLRDEGFKIERYRNVWYCYNQRLRPHTAVATAGALSQSRPELSSSRRPEH